MDKSEMNLVINVDQVVIIGIHLDRRQLALVHDVFAAERAHVVPIVEANLFGADFAQNVKLPLKELFVKALRVCASRRLPFPIPAPQNNNRL
jgi:hypothetical protein